MSVNSRTNEGESWFQCGGFIDRRIGMEPLVIGWAKEKANFFSQVNSSEGVLRNNEFFKKFV